MKMLPVEMRDHACRRFKSSRIAYTARGIGVFAFQGIEREFENYNDDLIFHPLKEWKNTKIFTIIKFNIYVHIYIYIFF